MKKIKKTLMNGIAKASEKAFIDAMGLASRGGTYEPKIEEKAKILKANNISTVEKLYNRLVR